MDPAVATLDFAKAGAIIANMIESYLAAGAPPSNPEGAAHDDLQDCRSTSVAGSLHLHSPIDAGEQVPLQSGEHRAPVQSSEQGEVHVGWNPEQISGSSTRDLGQSGARATNREDFKTLVSDVAMG